MGFTYKYLDVGVEWGVAATSIEGIINNQAAAGWELHTMNVTMLQASGERLFSMVFQKRNEGVSLPIA